MAQIFYKSMNRRDFIRTSFGAMGSLVALGVSSSFGSGKSEKAVARWALVSDTHIAEDVNDQLQGLYSYKNLQKAVPGILSFQPKGVIITGDLARMDGQVGDYVRLKESLDPVAEKMPVFLALGNHDDRRNFSQVFTEFPGEIQRIRRKHVTVVDSSPVRMLVLDTLLYVNVASGLLGKMQRRWLENYLKTCDDTPIFLCFHHTLKDRDMDLLDVERLFRIIKPVRKVKAIVYGHSHAYGYSEFEGIHLINLPPTSYLPKEGYNQRTKSYSAQYPIGWIEAKLTVKGGDFTLRTVAANQEMNGSVKSLEWRV